MRKSIREFVKICVETLPIAGPIYEFGAFQMPEQERLADLRPFFPGKEYIGVDMQKGPGVDIVADIKNTNLPSNSAGIVLAMDTLEHVEFVRETIEEAHRLLRPDGMLIISSVMNFPLHSYPCDYWRFTPGAFESLLKPFNSSFVGFAGKSNFPVIVVGIGFKGPVPDGVLNDFIKRFKPWKEYWGSPFRDTWHELYIPPLFLTLYQKLRGIA